jgi:ParB-like chromosome segregation protein Spo0J
MQIENIPITALFPYEKNPRKNDNAIGPVAESIKRYGFLVPIVIDKHNVIAAGHTRLLAAKQLGLTEVPCVRAEHLTKEQIREFRLVDNKTAEFASWDKAYLSFELDAIAADLSAFGFDYGDLIPDANFEPGNEDEQQALDRRLAPEVVCPHCGESFSYDPIRLKN